MVFEAVHHVPARQSYRSAVARVVVSGPTPPMTRVVELPRCTMQCPIMASGRAGPGWGKHCFSKVL